MPAVWENAHSGTGNTTAKAVGGHTEQQSAHGPEGECQKEGFRDGFDGDMEVAGDIFEHKHQDKKVKGVQRPA